MRCHGSLLLRQTPLIPLAAPCRSHPNASRAYHRRRRNRPASAARHRGRGALPVTTNRVRNPGAGEDVAQLGGELGRVHQAAGYGLLGVMRNSLLGSTLRAAPVRTRRMTPWWLAGRRRRRSAMLLARAKYPPFRFLPIRVLRHHPRNALACRPWDVAVRTRCRSATACEQGRRHRRAQKDRDDTQGDKRRHFVEIDRGHLCADKHQHRRQADLQVAEPVDGSGEQEEQRAQA
jgi:hypothetical protein